MLERIKSVMKKVMQMFTRDKMPEFAGEVKVSDKMASAISSWVKVFYKEPSWAAFGVKQTNFAVRLTSFVSTLATNEIDLHAGTGPRAEYIDEQIQRFVLPGLFTETQLAAVSGQIVLKPFVSGKNIMVDAVSADRFYPTRINSAGVYEAAFFTDYAQLRGRTVVRVEWHDLQPDGIYIQHKAYYEDAGELTAPVPLTDVPEWADIEPDILIKGVDRPLFAVIKMPFANSIDPTSRLPVSFFANAMEALEELDLIYSDFLYEIHSGKRKRIVDRDALRLEEKRPGRVSYKDLATDLYITLDREDKKPFDDYTPDLRVDEYQKAMDIQLRLVETNTGLSTGTFGFDIKTGRMTATQVVSDDKDTYNTIKTIQEAGMKNGLLDLVYVMDVFAELYGLGGRGTVEPSVAFGDSIFEDTGVEFARRKAMVEGDLLKGEKFVSWYFGITEEEALKDYMPAPEAPVEPFFAEE